MEPVKVVERGGAKGAGKKMRRREGEWTAPLPLAKGCQSIRGRQKEQKGRESNWAPPLDLTAVSPPTLPRRTNKRPMQLVSPTTLPRDSQAIDLFSFSFLFSSPVFQHLLFLFSGFNFLLSTMYFSREILLTKTLEKIY